MPNIDILVLAILQGATEFLPVGSSGHLFLVPQLYCWGPAALGVELGALLGALLAVVVCYLGDLVGMAQGLLKMLQGKRDDRARLIGQLLVATLPYLAAAFLIERYAGGSLRSAMVVGNALAGFGLLLYGADKLGLTVRKANNVGDKIFMEGNAAAALGCVYGGATVCAWYPITPSSSLAEAFQFYCSRLRVDKETGKNKFAIIQAEDELASIGIVTGAGWNGARAFTATSGPGISLMSEFIGLAYFAEIPAVVIDVQRGGPSTGMPTRTQQSDVVKCAYLSHGDTKHVLLFPEDPHECFTMAADCLDLAERLQTPVFLMTDLDIGMNQRLCKRLEWDDARQYDRGKIMTAEMLDAGKEFGRYLDVDGDGIPYRTYPGTHPSKGAYFTRGTSRNPYAVYSEAGPDYQYNMQRLQKKFDFAKTLVPKPILTPAKEPARFGCIYYGSTSPSMHEALESLAQRNIYINALRIRSFPFQDEINDFVRSHSKVFVVEQNRDAQLKTLLVNDAGIDPASLISVLHYDGTPITARFITQEISQIVSALNVRPIKKDKAA